MEIVPNSSVLVALLIILISFASSPTSAQYNTGYEEPSGGGGDRYGYGYGNGGGGAGGYGDERPKIHLGLRLKIPAIKFDLPRLSLPKITISAKIRQPDKPRTITLPEINLDTSSKVASQTNMNAGGDSYGSSGRYATSGGSYGSASYGGNSYADNGGNTQTFSFSTSGEDEQPAYQSLSYGGSNNYKYKSQSNKQQSSYSSTNIRPSYTIVGSNPTTQQHTNQMDEQQYYQSPVAMQQSSIKQYNRNSGAGFNAPVYTDSTSYLGQGDQVTAANAGYNVIDTTSANRQDQRQLSYAQSSIFQTPKQPRYEGRMSSLTDSVEKSAVDFGTRLLDEFAHLATLNKPFQRESYENYLR